MVSMVEIYYCYYNEILFIFQLASTSLNIALAIWDTCPQAHYLISLVLNVMELVLVGWLRVTSTPSASPSAWSFCSFSVEFYNFQLTLMALGFPSPPFSLWHQHMQVSLCYPWLISFICLTMQRDVPLFSCLDFIKKIQAATVLGISSLQVGMWNSTGHPLK